MLAAVATGFDADRPLDGLQLADVTLASPPTGWVRVDVRATALNHHDIWALRGMTSKSGVDPLVLGTDAAGVTADGREVIVHAVLTQGSLLSESAPGTFAGHVFAPAENLIPLPEGLSFEEAACLPTSYLTAYNMLFGRARVLPGEHILVQGAGGGVATALVLIAVAAGVEVTVSSRSSERAQRSLDLGAHHAIVSGERLPSRVDAVLETVGKATWSHSLRSVRPGGRIVVAGGTSGFDPSAELNSLFMRDVSVFGTYMGNQQQLALVSAFMVATGVRPLIDSVHPLAEIKRAFERLHDGRAFGKVVIHVSD